MTDTIKKDISKIILSEKEGRMFTLSLQSYSFKRNVWIDSGCACKYRDDADFNKLPKFKLDLGRNGNIGDFILSIKETRTKEDGSSSESTQYYVKCY